MPNEQTDKNPHDLRTEASDALQQLLGLDDKPLLSPELTAELLMNSLSLVDGEIDRDEISLTTKAFWLEVAHHMGPDHSQRMFHVSKFVTKVA